jgi:hypothetical protein
MHIGIRIERIIYELDKDYFDIATARVTNKEDLEVRGEDF